MRSQTELWLHGASGETGDVCGAAGRIDGPTKAGVAPPVDYAYHFILRGASTHTDLVSRWEGSAGYAYTG